MTVAENKHVKIGDYVRLIQSERKLNKLSYGYVYKVLSVQSNRGYVDDSVYITELESPNGVVILKMQESYFEILPPRASVKKKFQVGDKVICVKNTPEVQEGWIGFITPEKSDFGFVAENEVGQGYAFTEDELELLTAKPVEVKTDAVNHPKHYAVFEQLEAIEVIASSMTTEQFYGYCLGNILKYRLRAGGKDDVMQELGKADKYQELFTQFKSLCKDVK